MTTLTDVKRREPPPAAQVMDISMRYWQSMCLHSVATLGIADVLARGPLEPGAIAQQVGAQAELVRRLLRALASLNVFEEDEQGRFKLTALGETLRSDHPQSTLGYVTMATDDWSWNSWRNGFVHGLKTGEIPFEHVYGGPYFELQARNVEREKIFAKAMESFSGPQIKAIAAAYPFDELDTIVDVGGGGGHLLAAILRHYPTVKGVLYDLPGVMDGELARRYIDAPDLTGRIRAESGNMFRAVPKGFNGYVMKNVIHDWNDAESITILSHCREAMAPAGRMILAEGIVKPLNEPDHMKFIDLTMFVFSGGQERTEREYRDLLARAGLRATRVLPTASDLSIIEAVRA